MNVENILKVADAIEQHSVHDLGFNMGVFRSSSRDYEDLGGNECQTVACIAGWTVAVFSEQRAKLIVAISEVLFFDIKDVATEHLGLTPREAGSLFMPSTFDPRSGEVDPYSATPAQAAEHLRRVAATGDCVWPGCVVDSALSI